MALATLGREVDMVMVERRTKVVDCDTHFRQTIRQWFPYVDERFKVPVAR